MCMIYLHARIYIRGYPPLTVNNHNILIIKPHVSLVVRRWYNQCLNIYTYIYGT